MNWRTASIVIGLLCLVVFAGGYFLGRHSVSKEKETVYVDRILEVPVTDTLTIPPITLISPPDTVYPTPDFRELESGDSLICSIFNYDDEIVNIEVRAYAPDTVAYFEHNIDFKPIIRERTLTVVVTDTIETEIIIKKPGLKERGTWALIGAGIVGIIVAIGGVF